MTDRFRTAINLRKRRTLASACPNCYRDGTALHFQTGTDTLAFECSCGTRWLTTGTKAKAHAIWLDRQGQPRARNIGDL